MISFYFFLPQADKKANFRKSLCNTLYSHDIVIIRNNDSARFSSETENRKLFACVR